jgi:methyl-accepting chemotaxis protein
MGIFRIVGSISARSFIQELAKSAEVFDGAGKVLLISNNGSLAGVTGSPEMIGKSLEKVHQDGVEDLAIVQKGEESAGSGWEHRVFQPSGSVKPHTLVSEHHHPYGRCHRSGNSMMWRMIGIGIGLVLFSWS